MKRHSSRMVEIKVYQQVNCSLNIPLHRESLSAFSLTHLFGQNTPLLTNLTSVVGYTTCWTVESNYYGSPRVLFWAPKTALAQSLRYMKPAKGQTVREQQGPRACGREGERGEHEQEAGGSSDPITELGSGAAGQGQGWGQRSGADTAQQSPSESPVTRQLPAKKPSPWVWAQVSVWRSEPGTGKARGNPQLKSNSQPKWGAGPVF